MIKWRKISCYFHIKSVVRLIFDGIWSDVVNAWWWILNHLKIRGQACNLKHVELHDAKLETYVAI